MKGIDRQKRYFEQLIDVIDNPIFVANNWRQNDEWRPGKRYFLGKGGKSPPIDHRIIGSNEVVLELDAPSFTQNSTYTKKIIEVLRVREIPHYCFWSGNKSIHIHIFLDIDIKNPELLKLVKEAFEKNINIFFLIRINFATEIIEQAGINKDLIGMGKTIDMAKLKWDDIGGKANLIRVCGGANVKVQKDESIKRAWKTYLKEIPDKKPKLNQYDEVEYPEKLERFEIEESFVNDCIQKILDDVGKVRDYKKIDYKGEHLNFPCIQRIREGMPEGQRSASAKLLAIASKLDNLPVDKAKGLVTEFIDTCPQIVPFTSDEGYRWVDWVYNQVKPFWNCGIAKDLGICHQVDCPYFKEKYKEEMDIFNVDNPLGVIKKALDKTIVGEDSLKMQCFLLFHTKHQNPEWCIIVDGPAASGKSHIIKEVLKLFGDEGIDYFVYSRLTGASMNHMEALAKTWEGTIVFIEEIQGARSVVEQLRVAISEGKLTLLETVETNSFGKTKAFESKAKTVVFKDVLFVTCNAEVFEDGDQMKSRAWLLNTDQTRDQTKKIVDFYMQQFSGVVDTTIPNLDEIRAGIRFLEKPDEVVFPFSNEIKNIVPTDSVRGRRDVKKFIALIKACAYFCQKKRLWYTNKHQKSVLIADWRDVELVLGIAGDALISTAQGVGPKDLKYYDKIILGMSLSPGDGSFGYEDVGRWCGISYPGARKLMSNLSEAGFFENLNQRPLPAEFIKVNGSEPFYLDDMSEQIKENIKNQSKFLEEFVKNEK